MKRFAIVTLLAACGSDATEPPDAGAGTDAPRVTNDLRITPGMQDFGMVGVGMVFAEFIARSDGAPAVAAYREAFQPSVYRVEPFAGVATIALAADTAEEADRLVALTPRPPPRPGEPPEGEGFIRRFRGDAAAVRDYLAEKAAHTGADEIFVLNGGPTLESRLRSMELIAEGWSALQPA